MRILNHQFCHWIATFVTTFIVGTVASTGNAAEQHPLVGKPFKPADVDYNNPVYETSFEDEVVLRDWRLEGGKQMSVVNDNLVLQSQPTSNDSNHLVCWLTKEAPSDFLLDFTVRPRDRKEGLNIVFLMRGVSMVRASSIRLCRNATACSSSTTAAI